MLQTCVTYVQPLCYKKSGLHICNTCYNRFLPTCTSLLQMDENSFFKTSTV
ncbi:hypothetical protein Hanom_Chr06g00493241 [Helianthus anomalus]